MNNVFRLSGLKWLVCMLDFIVVFICYLFASAIRFHGQIPQIEFNSFLHYAPWLGILGIGTYHFFGLYNFSSRLEYSKYFYNLIIAHVMIVIELIMINHWLQIFVLPRNVVIIAVVLQLFFTVGLRSVLFYFNSTGTGKKRAMIIVNDSKTDMAIIEKVQIKGHKWFEVKGVIQANAGATSISESSFSEIDLFILGPNLDPKLKSEFVRTAGRKRKEILLIPEFYELFLMGAESQQIDDMLVYSIMPPHLSRFEKMIKRSIDIFLSLVLLIVTSPVMLLMLALIPMSSKGKALFKQERIGLDEKPFMVMKFRSMVDNAEMNTGPVLAIERDARITKIGQFIRATRIDELPQLFNVIKGEMSLVGPRPEREFFIYKFNKELPHYAYRFMVKPGITGLAQVMGNYSTLPSDKLRYDLMYIKNYSPLLDLKILFQTIVVVLQREQSKGVNTDELTAGNKNNHLLNAPTEVVAMKE
jgi:exopolysaccharide biosynthesis polyprenyl glycosylphosphotransferase